MAAGAEFTISSLADESGLTVRTLRDYSVRGLLPPPEMRGRTGFYGEEHLNRVRIIGRLLERGITLNGVRGLLEAWDRGDDLADVLGVAAPPAAPERPTHPISEKLIAATDLAQLVHDVPDGLRRVVAAGIYEPVDATTYRVANGEVAELLEQLVADGVPAAEAVGEVERLRADCDHIARKFVDLFERSSVRPFRRSGRTPQDVDRLTERLTAARTRPGRMATALIDEFVGRHLAYLVTRDLNDVPLDRG
ncbi:MerR family transcriptional regulator [Nocardia mexicana]|uniref:DNA-binding transcriptional MerR regulator n=1 Tax=Nocardia mexicana TaxID=279262 RepID=A0A370HG31_9NOCA|nr:MerR family transcriptional regulator [Nocardia mexicana]RDI56022.1 DNA-binding transcriptional MerR regulator [Nocardia mexicana]